MNKYLLFMLSFVLLLAGICHYPVDASNLTCFICGTICFVGGMICHQIENSKQ